MIAMITTMAAAYYIFTKVFIDAWSNTFAILIIISVFVIRMYFALLFRK